MSKKKSYNDLNNDIQRKQAELKALKKQQRLLKKHEEENKNAQVGAIVREVFASWGIDEATDEKLKELFIDLRQNVQVGAIVRDVFSEWHIDEATDENLKIFFIGLRDREKDFRNQQRAQQQQNNANS